MTLTVSHLDLPTLFSSGQCFRMHPMENGAFLVLSGEQALRVTPLGGGRFRFSCASSRWPYWQRYFDLETDYDALLLPGGRAPEYLRLNKKVIALIQAFAKAGKPIAAICHGPQLLTAANVIRGKKISSYPACEPEVLAAGAEFVALPLEGAVTDGQFVTGPAWTAHVEWLKQFIALLNA